LKADNSLLSTIERLVDEAEAQTSAELVVVIARRSGRYRDVPWKLGAGFALLMLAAVLYLPVDFDADWIGVDVLLGFGIGFVLGLPEGGLHRWLTTRARREREVRRAAEAVFTSRGVSLTRERTGLLIYLSFLERRAEILWDVGLERRVPLATWNVALMKARPLFAFRDPGGELKAALQLLLPPLREHLPASADNPNEIPNRPVVLE